MSTRLKTFTDVTNSGIAQDNLASLLRNTKYILVYLPFNLSISNSNGSGDKAKVYMKENFTRSKIADDVLERTDEIFKQFNES